MHKILVTLMAFALTAAAADVTGTWIGKVDVGNAGSDPTIPWSVTLKQNGSELTGTAGDASHQFPIEKAEIHGNSVTFQVTAGAVLSRLIVTETLAVLPALSFAVPETNCPPPSVAT